MFSLEDLGRAITTRRSYRLPYDPIDVSEEEIRACLDLARWAPSAHNAQPWRFVAFYRQNSMHQEIRQAIAESMAARFEADLLGDDMDPDQARQAALASIQRYTSAPVLIIVCMDESVLAKYVDEQRIVIEGVMGEQSVAAAITLFLVALEACGLQACWQCAPLFCPVVVKEAIGLPEAWQPQAFILVGHGQVSNPIGGPLLQKHGRMPGTARHPVDEILFSPESFREDAP